MHSRCPQKRFNGKRRLDSTGTICSKLLNNFKRFILFNIKKTVTFDEMISNWKKLQIIKDQNPSKLLIQEYYPQARCTFKNFPEFDIYL